MENKIKFDERNYRKHSDQNKKIIKKSLQELGAGRSVVIDADDTLVAGNGVYEQAQALKMPVRVVETDGSELVVVKRTDIHTTDEKRKKLALADNSASDLSEWDVDLLRTDWAKEVLDGFGVELPEFEDPTETKEAQEDDFDEERDKVETVCKKGDIWLLGQHRLMCGDSTDADVVGLLMQGEKAELALTDPPYGIDVVSDDGKVGADFGVAKQGDYKKVIADDTTDTAEKAYEMLKMFADRLIIWGGNYFTQFLPFSDSWLIWDKRCESGIRNTFADGEMAWCSFHTPIRIYHQLWNGMIREGEHEKRVHPTQKPIKMLGDILKDFSKEADNVLDLFGGSGSTLIACEQLGRKCYMMELDPHYCDVIIARWEKLTGQKAIKTK